MRQQRMLLPVSRTFFRSAGTMSIGIEKKPSLMKYVNMWRSKPATTEYGHQNTGHNVHHNHQFDKHVVKNGAHVDFHRIPHNFPGSGEGIHLPDEEHGIILAKAAEAGQSMFARDKDEFFKAMEKYMVYEHCKISHAQLMEWRDHVEKSLVRGFAFYLFQVTAGEPVVLENVLLHSLPQPLHDLKLMHKEEMLEELVNGFIKEFCERFVEEETPDEGEEEKKEQDEPSLL